MKSGLFVIAVVEAIKEDFKSLNPLEIGSICNLYWDRESRECIVSIPLKSGLFVIFQNKCKGLKSGVSIPLKSGLFVMLRVESKDSKVIVSIPLKSGLFVIDFLFEESKKELLVSIPLKSGLFVIRGE